MERMDRQDTKTDRAWMEIDLRALKNNAKMIEKAMPDGCRLMAVVKADAYGHGAVPVAKAMNEIGVEAFAVATTEEGIALRKAGIRGTILILGYTDPKRVMDLETYGLRQTILSADYAKELVRAKKLAHTERKLPVEIKIDSGMHRQGVECSHLDEIKEIFSFPELDIRGMYTHFCVADSSEAEDISYTREQIRKFDETVHNLEAEGIRIPLLHMQSSYGLLNYPDVSCDYARIGILLYGSLSSARDKTQLELFVQPVMELKARVMSVREVEAGETVGYGRAFKAERRTKLATVAVGYGDGIPRNLSCGRGHVLIHGKKVPIAGRICMDQMLIDVTDVENVSAGDIVTVVGCDGGEEIRISELADEAGTIANELVSRLGSRWKHIYRK